MGTRVPSCFSRFEAPVIGHGSQPHL
eukprot:SAG11_NODE_28076_length_325_cov_3.911504_1_plen_25_part_01